MMCDTSSGIVHLKREDNSQRRKTPTLYDIDYVTIASEGNAIDFGDLTQARYLGACGNSSTRGVFLSGNTSNVKND